MDNVMTNPNPSRITDEMWWLWQAFKDLEPTVRLGGIYANKSGYHNTRAANDANWPGNYSVVLTSDRQGPSDKAAAIDLTFPDAQAGDYKTINKYASRLLAAGKDLMDERTIYMREFYGQTDVDLAVEGWDFQRDGAASSDSSHLWHIHISIIRAFVDNWKAMRAIYSILKGESVETWRANEVGGDMPLTDAEITAIAAKVAKKVWDLDYIPVDGTPTNLTWAAKNALSGVLNVVRKSEIKLDALVARPVPAAIDYPTLAAAIVALLPAGALSKTDVEDAVNTVLSRVKFGVIDS